MDIHTFRKLIDNIDNSLPDYSDKEVTVMLSMPSIGATASSRVKDVSMGFDWDNWQVMIGTEDRLIKK
jgi:hypothetical protein